ncbi:MAG: carbamoyltransferase [Chloroflexota bacterium]|nr:carbamoyltransferase [Chloroflexota bacterium]
MYILGLTTMGNAAAALICDGEVVAAAEEERFSRVKQHIGFPDEAVAYCLNEAGIDLADVARVGLYWKPWVLRHKAVQALKSATISRDMFKARVDRGVAQVSDSYLGMLRYPARLRSTFGPSDFRFHFLDHHLCHAASTFYLSPFKRSAILTMDGTGEATTTLLASGEDTAIHELRRIKLPHSLGQFYSAVTNFLGFDMFAGDEWKVMGLASYGSPVYEEFFSTRVLAKTRDGSFRVNIRVLDHHLAKHYRFGQEVVANLGPPRSPDEEISSRHQNIAASAQRVLEEVVLHMISRLHDQTGHDNLCLAGGVALNSVANGRIVKESAYSDVFIQPAAHDAGCALGAALLIHHGRLGADRGPRMNHAYYGPSFSSAECAAALEDLGVEYVTLSDEELLPRLAALIADGAVVGWFQGRMEFGPRALGNRSFLADPRRADIREILNHKVKLREWFRPLAPSMLAEASEEVFGIAHMDPFMVTVLRVLDEYRERIPAVVHVDHSARPQTVTREVNPRFWNLIDEFRKLTGIPMLLNTSFNVQEPIVCTPRDAAMTFSRTKFEAMVLENHLVIRP